MSDGDEAARRRTAAVTEYRKKLLHHKELESRVRTGSISEIILILSRRSDYLNLFFFCFWV